MIGVIAVNLPVSVHVTQNDLRTPVTERRRKPIAGIICRLRGFVCALIARHNAVVRACVLRSSRYARAFIFRRGEFDSALISVVITSLKSPISKFRFSLSLPRLIRLSLRCLLLRDRLSLCPTSAPGPFEPLFFATSDSVKLLKKLIAIFAGGIGSSSFLCQISLSGDFGILEGVRPGAQLPGNAFGEGFQI